jgi:D-beta-D-heptose 7-phosphate kinase/D-beta-D-heptose 1-phosphate adenosyltransferase
MVDQYIWGQARRLSPEAPVPVVAAEREEPRVGGAALVAAHLAALGMRVSVCGVVGSDVEGDWLRQTLGNLRIAIDGVLPVAGRCTTRKSRIMIDRHQVARFDREQVDVVDDAEWQTLMRHIECACAEGTRVLAISNYAKGVLTPERMTEILGLRARWPDMQVLVDPKFLPWHALRGASVVKPNRAELVAAVGASPDAPWSELQVPAEALRKSMAIHTLVVTLGAEGIAMLSDDGTLHLQAHRVGVHDVTGAGDAVLAGLVWATAQGWKWAQRVAFANRCGALSVSHLGTVVLDPVDLRVDQWHGSGAHMSLPQLLDLAQQWRAQGDSVVLTNGCFDLLHAGHLQLLEGARALGARLVVAVNSDDSVRRLKGAQRPLVPEEGRCRLLAALRCVDAVVLFDEDTPLAIVEALSPDVLCKGADYTVETVVGAAHVRSYGGAVVLLPLKPATSTTRLVETIQQRQGG